MGRRRRPHIHWKMTTTDRDLSKDPAELEAAIKKIVVDSLKDQRDPDAEVERIKALERKRQHDRDLYQKAHEKALFAIGNRDNVKIEKIGHGRVTNTDDDLFDGIYSKDGKRFAV